MPRRPSAREHPSSRNRQSTPFCVLYILHLSHYIARIARLLLLFATAWEEKKIRTHVLSINQHFNLHPVIFSIYVYLLLFFFSFLRLTSIFSFFRGSLGKSSKLLIATILQIFFFIGTIERVERIFFFSLLGLKSTSYLVSAITRLLGTYWKSWEHWAYWI